MSEAPETAAESAPQSPPARDYRPIAIALAAALLLAIALVATAPLWAPQPPSSPPPHDAALDARLDRIDARLAALEAKPVPPPSADLGELRQQIGKLSARIDSVEQAVRAPPATDTTDMALTLALLQIRDAIEFGRPFAPVYDSLVALARARPEIAAAAAPLAGPAQTGIATRAVLAKRLHELAPVIAEAAPPPADSAGETADWTDAALARLRRLVTIRRLDDGGPARTATGADAAVNAAERALAGGDLDGAAAALDKLSGPAHEAAGPWQRMAQERLAVEAAMRKIEAQLVARLGGSAPR